MPQVSFTDHTGTSRRVPAAAGDSAMQAAVRNGVPGIVAECGGSLSCATCHVFVDPGDAGALPPMGDLEDEMLHGTAVGRRETSRLSCQLTLTEGLDLRVTTPSAQV